jgi:hypothetical protein
MIDEQSDDDEIIDVMVTFLPDRTDYSLYWKIYKTEQKYHASESGFKKIIWGRTEKRKRVCRFCKKDAVMTTFDKKAHAIPALIGNKFLFTDYECDNCNAIFGRYESELGNFGGAWHTMSLVNGRNGVPKFKDKKNNFSITGSDNRVQLHLNVRKGINHGIQFNHDGTRMIINTFKPAFVPLDVLKCFIKIAFTFMDEDTLDDYDKTRRWLIGEIDNNDMHPYFLVPRARGKKIFKEPLIMLMKKEDSKIEMPFVVPEHSLLIFYGIFIYQIYIPFHRNEGQEFKKGQIYLPIEEHLCKEIPSDNPLGAAEINYMNMGAKVRVSGIEEKIVLPFKKL